MATTSKLYFVVQAKAPNHTAVNDGLQIDPNITNSSPLPDASESLVTILAVLWLGRDANRDCIVHRLQFAPAGGSAQTDTRRKSGRQGYFRVA
jgi:hypothetical protein